MGEVGPSGPIEEMPLQDVLAIQRECQAIFAQSEWQKFFARVGRETYPNKVQYIEAIVPAIEEMQGKVMKKYGYITDHDPYAVHKALVKCNSLAMKYWRKSREFQRRSKDLLRLTRQNAPWPQHARKKGKKLIIRR